MDKKSLLLKRINFEEFFSSKPAYLDRIRFLPTDEYAFIVKPLEFSTTVSFLNSVLQDKDVYSLEIYLNQSPVFERAPFRGLLNDNAFYGICDEQLKKYGIQITGKGSRGRQRDSFLFKFHNEFVQSVSCKVSPGHVHYYSWEELPPGRERVWGYLPENSFSH